MINPRALLRWGVDLVGATNIWHFLSGLKITGDLELATGQHVKGQRFTVSVQQIFGGISAGVFFVAPAACKVVSAYERHTTVCDAADVANLEKLNTGEALGAGDLVLGTGFTLNSTANTPVTRAAVTGDDAPKASLVAGDALAIRLTSGDGTDYAGGNITVTLEWL